MKNTTFSFAVAGSIMTILFLAFINYTTSKGYLWFIYPTFAILWWPLSIFFAARGKVKSFAVAGSLLLIGFLITINYMFSPIYPWFLFTLMPVLWWPVTMLLGRRAASLSYAIVSFITAILYYGAINILLSPAHPWIIYVAFGMIWWPMTLFFILRKQQFAYSIAGALVTIIFFITVNYITTPGHPWFIYPAFTVLWWPLSMYYFVFKKRIY